MNSTSIWFVVIYTLLAPLVMASEQPVIKPPSEEELRAIQLPDSIEITVYAFKNSEKYAFAIFRCKVGSRICYFFRSEQVKDYLCLSVERVAGRLEDMSRTEVLRFFSVRFRGIANDIGHQKWRPDVVIEPLGPLEPLGADDAKTIVLFAVTYDGYASAMEDLLAAESQGQKGQP